MTQEHKELLLKDLCARLPYDVKCKIEMWKGYDICTIYNINSIGYVEIVEDSDTNGVNIERVKPYLFPLSSMTEEQQLFYSTHLNYMPYYQRVDWFNEQHLDYRGLISMGLAIDATGLNIY